MAVTDRGKDLAQGPIVIVCSADNSYVMPLAAMIKSLLVNIRTTRNIILYVIDGGISGPNQEKLLKSWYYGQLTVNFVPMHSEISPDMPLWGRMKSNIIYQKLLMPTLLPESVHKAIFLDCDMTIKGNIAELWETAIGDRSILAVQDLVIPYMASRYGVSSHKELGIDPHAKYFNTGLMVVNLLWWRNTDVVRRAFNFLEKYREIVFFFDQEALNAVLSGTWGELDPRWNQIECVSGRAFFRCSHLDENTYHQVVENPLVCHYAGTFKPWIHHNRRPSQRLYFEYLDMTEWSGWRPELTLKSLLFSLYEAQLRNIFYPAEKLYMKFQKSNFI